MRKLFERHFPIVGVIYTVLPVTAAAIVTYLAVRKTLGPEPAAVAVVFYLIALVGLAALVFWLFPKAFGLRRGNKWWVSFLRSGSWNSNPTSDMESRASDTGRSE